MRYFFVVMLAAVFSLPAAWAAAGGMEDDPLLAMVMVDQLESRLGNGNPRMVWDAEGWIGRDRDKIWLKTEGEAKNGRLEEAEAQLLYSRAVAPYWDLQMGLRHDFRPRPRRDWLVLGIKGLAPWFFDVDLALFVGEDGRTAARLTAEYEIMFTQRLALLPEVEVDLAGRSDPDIGSGSGLVSTEVGLRLRYEVRRRFAPYVGVTWTGLHGETADYAREEGEKTSDTRFAVGIRAWY